jgi:hypothetical protein
MELDIHAILGGLAHERNVFHSEADFQHAFAWRIHRDLPDAKIRLEVPMELALPAEHERVHIDVLVDGIWAIELKYKTRQSEYAVGEEGFVLRGHGAQDFGRYDFVKDIQRVEAVVLEGPCTGGYAIMLTNDDQYWKRSDRCTMDAAFRIADGQTIGGTLRWADPSRPWLKGRADDLLLRGRYALSWTGYSELGFRYVVIQVRPDEPRGF